MTDPAHPPVDFTVLPGLTGCDDAMLEEFLEDFLLIAADADEALRHADAAGDLLALRHAAHRIKSSSRYIGAERLGDLADELELAAEREESARCTALLPKWRVEWQAVDAFINAYLDSEDPPA